MELPDATQFSLAEGIAILERTPQVLRSLLLGLSAEWLQSRERGDSWHPQEIVGHLIHGEKTDWMPRARLMLQHGEERPFDSFDRFAQSREPDEQPIEQLLAEFAELRARNLQALQQLHLQELDLERTGRHPELGVVTLSQLLATWVVHDLGHLRQISRALAARYRQAVGPWNRPDFLRVLHGAGPPDRAPGS
jgi:hypothetical protein